MRIFLPVLLLFFGKAAAIEKQKTPEKIVLITGASKGIGLATSELLAECGYKVYATTRNLNLPSLHKKKNFIFLSVDLKNPASIYSAVQKILDEEGRIDILINNAGYALVGPVETMQHEEIEDQMHVNFLAPIQVIQAVLPCMRNQKSGHIINISSINAIVTPPYGSIYAASKAALESLSESLSIELQPFNIAVSIIEPGLLKTHFNLQLGSKNMAQNPYAAIVETIKNSLEERLANPECLEPSQSSEEIARFLLSVIEDSHPKLRYQTSKNARNEVSKKLIDLDGALFLKNSAGEFMKTIQHIKQKEAIQHANSSQCNVYEYPMQNPEISIGVAEISGRYPDEGYAVNHTCSEMGYVLEGTGTLVTEKQEIELSPGDVVYIPPGEKFYWSGNLKIILPTSPAWNPQQHEIVSPALKETKK